MNSQFERLNHYIEKSSNTVAITGAGISFASGGLSFDEASPKDMQGMMDLGSQEVLENDPDHYYQVLDQAFLHSMFEVGPSIAHKALALLEQQGQLQGIITTNIDCLHTIAGSQNVAEIQGSLQVNKCMSCGKHFDDVDIWRHGTIPECDECGGKIWTFPFYSHIGLNRSEVRHARKMISKAELIIIIGAEGNYGNAYWPYRSRKATIVQINPGHTAFDEVADLNIHLGSEEVFKELMNVVV